MKAITAAVMLRIKAEVDEDPYSWESLGKAQAVRDYTLGHPAVTEAEKATVQEWYDTLVEMRLLKGLISA